MKKTSLILLFVAHCFSAWAQFENKISISAAIGIPFIKSAGIIQAENIYYGYGKIPTLKIGMQYNIKPKFGLGPVIGQLYSTKPNFKLTVSSFGIGAKYNFVPFDKKISPFLYLEGDINYVTISQKANSVEENPEVDDKEQIMIVSQIRNYPEILTGFTCMGVVLGAGSDFTFNRKYTLFLAFNYTVTNAAKTYTSKNNFEENTSKLQYMVTQVGVRFSFLQKKKLY